MQRALVKVMQPSFIDAHRFLSARHVAFWPGFLSNMAEKEEFTDIRGKPIKLSCQNYSPLCREFTISSCKLSLVRVMVLTCGVWLLAYAGFYLTQNTAVLSAAIFVTLSGMLLHVHFVKVDHETLLIIGSLGVQLSSAYASGRESTTFIEMSRIKDIVINEAIHMQCCPAFPELKAEAELPGAGVQELSGDNWTDTMTTLTEELKNPLTKGFEKPFQSLQVNRDTSV
ncbi:hypothetical protein PGIGA_G00101830 [Pangasianodon gigas]|uniref:Uncharacterized protein n=1 Tax=Pangasianodon gigas TaxID=30993 RepID=A0ACC5XFZ4_PANGG|nr:hypothetical protein [Pangasianodon gigas]